MKVRWFLTRREGTRRRYRGLEDGGRCDGSGDAEEISLKGEQAAKRRCWECWLLTSRYSNSHASTRLPRPGPFRCPFTQHSAKNCRLKPGDCLCYRAILGATNAWHGPFLPETGLSDSLYYYLPRYCIQPHVLQLTRSRHRLYCGQRMQMTHMKTDTPRPTVRHSDVLLLEHFDA
jgi:hypothetical protein